MTANDTEIGLFAMKRDMINRFLHHFQSVNVEVHIVQMAPLALCNFVSYDLLRKGTGEPDAAVGSEEPAGDDDDESKKRCVVALDIGADNSNLVITDGERIIWQRPIPQGGNHFTRALTKDLKLTFAKAEHLKRNATKSPDLKKILSALKPVLNDFVGEVQRSLGYFTNTHRNAQIGYMVGLGNAFRLPGLQKFLSEKLQLDVRKLQKLDRLTGDSVTGAPQFQQNVLSFAVAYGLALQGLGRTRLHTNLLPHDIRIERMVRAKKPWAVAAAAALLVGAVSMTGAYALQYRQYGNKNVDAALEEGKRVSATWEKNGKDFSAKMSSIELDENNVRNIVSGQDERLNWMLLNRFVNECLPVPAHRVDGTYKAIIPAKNPKDALVVVTDRDGKDRKIRFDSEPGMVVEIKRDDKTDHKVVASILPDKTGKLQAWGDWNSLKQGQPVSVVYQTDPDIRKYWTKKAQDAYVALWQRQATVVGGDSKAEDEGVEDLIQINLEGMQSRYMTDLKGYMSALKADKHSERILATMSKKDRDNPPEGPGWVIELRGYTYHKGTELEFLKDVILKKVATKAQKQEDSGQAPAANPTTKPAADKAPADKKPAEATGKLETAEELWKKVIEGKISHAVLYQYNWFDNPDPVQFQLIGSSALSAVTGGGSTGSAGMMSNSSSRAMMGMVGGQGGSPTTPGNMPTTGRSSSGGSGSGWQSLLEGGSGGGSGRADRGTNAMYRGGAQKPPSAGGMMPDRSGAMGGQQRGTTFRPGEAPQPPRERDEEKKIGATRTEFIILFVWKEWLPSDERKGNAEESSESGPTSMPTGGTMPGGSGGR